MTSPLRSDAQAARDVVIFKALANAVRLQIVSIVAAAPEGQVSAGHIVDQFALSQPTISHHLKVLRDAGVLTAHKTSTFVFYRFTPQVRQAVSGLIPAEPVAQPPAQMPRPVRRSPTPRHADIDGVPIRSRPTEIAPSEIAPAEIAPAECDAPKVKVPASDKPGKTQKQAKADKVGKPGKSGKPEKSGKSGKKKRGKKKKK
ncbi:DNA-binding transcriptional ArsR family regulator [Antricoccus suffuscus]|uniref:DNA-binding transcriptional ArsR family regulator n=1 Tax=Antricoccus suffuscus TaxID=1629062 RepID=A0A2T0ZZ22_9ACTN|nr:metalloregulator ArsR/SmtB family transcription factor [Antricoccus suffuscus]PRZ41487.1 DNA-binding transcriptional ArsR family regulator [Antricoccus suffuscus]